MLYERILLVVLLFGVAFTSGGPTPAQTGRPVKTKKSEKEDSPPPPPEVIPVVPPSSPRPKRGEEESVPPPSPAPSPPASSSEHPSSVVPLQFIKNRVANLAAGSSAYVKTDAVKIDLSRKCWLVPTALTGAKSSERMVQVRRDATGFHVIFEQIDHQWEADDVNDQSLIQARTVTAR